jgi:penicillin V acylase-like amidase (Ntn superfamily)
VVNSASELAISGSGRVHFFACDETANCAVIEFLDGELVARSERTLPLAVLTNNTFNESLEYLNRTLGYGGEPFTPEGTGSLDRFARTASGTFEARSAAGDLPVGDSFAILDEVAQPDLTQWSIVYELGSSLVHFRTAANREIRTVNLAELDLDCTADPLILDLLAEGSGDAAGQLTPYSAEKNLQSIEAGFSADSLTSPGAEVIEAMAGYPDGLVCTFE